MSQFYFQRMLGDSFRSWRIFFLQYFRHKIHSFSFLNLFLLNLLGWYLLKGIYKFQLHLSMIHGLHVALHVHHPKSSHLSSPYISPPVPFTTLAPPFPLVATILVCVYGFLIFLFVHFLLSVLYPTWEWNYMVLNFFWFILLSMVYSRSIQVVANGIVSSFLWVV